MRKIAIYFAVLVSFFLIQYLFLSHRTQSFGFADENEHLGPAWMMLHQNAPLYRDLSTNHQPLPILAAFLLLKTVLIPNLFMLIERTRQFMFFLSFIGAFLLVWRFRLIGLVSAILIESIKFYFFGYHLLAESLVVYPLMFVAGILGEEVFPIPNFRKLQLNKYDDWLLGGAFFLIAFSLLPTWPFLLVSASFVLIFKFRSQCRVPVGFLVSFFILTLLMLAFFVDPKGWFDNTVVNNLKYFIPFESKAGATSPFSFLLYPFLGILSPGQAIARFFIFLSLSFLVAILGILRTGQQKARRKYVFYLGFFYLLLVLLNLRITTLDISFFGAFHVLPMAAFFTMLTAWLFFFFIKTLSSERQQVLLKIIGLATVVVIIFSSIGWWPESLQVNKQNEHFISYGDEESVGMALATIKSSGDTLLSGEQGAYVNIVSGVPFATKQASYLSWSYRVPSVRNDFRSILLTHPPVFVCFPEAKTNPFFVDLMSSKDKYVRVKRTGGKDTNLYILSSRINEITPEQWQKFAALLYEPP